TVFHGFLGEAIDDWRSCAALVKSIAHAYRLPYFTISPTFSICPDHGYLSGEHASCPRCGEETEIYTRIVGYYRSLKNWNRGKREEYRHRVTFDAADALPGARPPTGAARTNAGPAAGGAAQGQPAPDRPAGEAPLGPASFTYFFRQTCPNCPPVRRWLEQLGLDGEMIDADTEEGMRRAIDEQVLSTPTVILRDAAGAQLARGGDVSRLAELVAGLTSDGATATSGACGAGTAITAPAVDAASASGAS
ncbi:MAG: anaerobic ribonucleoside-triphosphate reductase, partial [Spirochaetota bacterium]